MWFVEVDLERNGSWIPLCGHRQKSRADACVKYFQPMAAFSGKPMRVSDGVDDDHSESIICPVTGQPCLTEQDEFCADYGCARKAGYDVDRPTE